MISSITLDDSTGTPVVLHAETGKRSVAEATGLVGISGVREAVEPRPTAHGSINRSRWTDGRLVVLTGEVMSTVGIEDAFAEFRAIEGALIQALENRALLKWTEGAGGNHLQSLVKLQGDVLPALAEGAAYLQYQAQLFAEDPRAYSQALQTITSDSLSATGGGKDYSYAYARSYVEASTGEAACVNAGNVSAPCKIRVYGYCTAPRVHLVETGAEIVLTGEIGAGDFIELDTQARTVKLNGATFQRGSLDSASTSWFDLPKGTSTVRLLTSVFDANAHLEVEFRSAYR